MATIKPYQDKKRNTLYYCRVYLGTDDEGKQRNKLKRGFKTAREANIWASGEIVKVEQRGIETKRDKALAINTFGELAEYWLDLHRTRVKPITIRNIKSALNNFSYKVFKDVPLDQITPLMIQKALIDWSKTHKAFRQPYQVLKRILQYGVSIDLIPANPCDKVIAPRLEREIDTNKHFWNVAEVNAFLEQARAYRDPVAYPLFRLMLYTGLRKGEALALRWCDIDFNNLTLTINQNLSASEDGKLIISTPKTKKSCATLPIDKQTIEALKDWKIEQSKRFTILGGSALLDKKALIFRVVPTDTPFSFSKLRDMLRTLSHLANVPIIRVHDLRHTQATLLLESGANIKDVQERLRHQDISTTLQTYSHVSEERKRDTIDNLVSYIEA